MKLAIIFFLLTQQFCFCQFQGSPKKTRFKKGIDKAGDIGQFVPMATSLTMLLIKKDKKGGVQLAKSLALCFATTQILKHTVKKNRPDGSENTQAFPSGHTALAFEGATFLFKRYSWKYGVPAMAVASFVGYSRVEGYGHHHDYWDVLGGAIVGFGSAYLFTKPYSKEHLKLSYSKLNNTYNFGITYTF